MHHLVCARTIPILGFEIEERLSVMMKPDFISFGGFGCNTGLEPELAKLMRLALADALHLLRMQAAQIAGTNYFETLSATSTI